MTSLTSYRRSKMKNSSNSDIRSIINEFGESNDMTTTTTQTTTTAKTVASDGFALANDDKDATIGKQKDQTDENNKILVRKERNNRRSVVR